VNPVEEVSVVQSDGETLQRVATTADLFDEIRIYSDLPSTAGNDVFTSSPTTGKYMPERLSLV
jgi:hypothetical protein